MPERQLQPRDRPETPVWCEDAETAPLDIIVFSKDRACQLDALLRSMREFFDLPHRLHVLYTTSSSEFELGYDLLRIWHRGVRWVGDGGVFGLTMQKLMAAIDRGPGRYLMFLVDDMMFTRTFTAGKLMESLSDDDDILAVSLRMGEDITYCYVRDIQTTPPDFSKGYRWSWKDASTGYWNYPMSQDAHIFRTSDFAELLPRLRFVNPNTLEATQSGHPFPRPDMVCEATSCVINIAANRVQSIYKNRCGNISAEFLNESFLAGLAIDVVPFTGRVYNSCHIDEDLALIDDKRDRSPHGFEKFERNGRQYFRVDLRKIPTFVLNCEDDTEKRWLMQEQLTELGLNFEFIPTLKVKPGWVGVALAHLKALRLSRAVPPFLVLEDDCVFNTHFQPVIEIPAEAEAVYLGVSIFGLEKPGKMSWGKPDKVLWEHFDEGYLRVHNMLARHALLYLDEDFQSAVIGSQVEALTNRQLSHMGDIGVAMLHHSHTVLALDRNVCRQRNRNTTDKDLAEALPGNEIRPAGSEAVKPAHSVPQTGNKSRLPRGRHLVSHKYRFIYFSIAKNASSTLRTELGKPHYQCEDIRFTQQDEAIVKEYFKFTFLRDPVSRFVSAYQEVSLRGEMDDSGVQKKPFMELEDNSERFEAFLTQVEAEKWDTHVRTQSDAIGHFHMDFYGRIESLENDLQLLFDTLGLPDCPPLPMRRSRAGRKSDYDYDRFNIDHNQLPQEQIDRIRELYKDDVALMQAFCPEATGPNGDSIARISSRVRALKIEEQGKLPPIELFKRVNTEHEQCMVYVLGDRGFYAEVTTVARAMIYAWVHGYQLLLASNASSWAHEKGWADYFEPFCPEPDEVDAKRIVESIEFRHDGDKTDFNRLRGFMPEVLSFGQTHLRGFQEILAFFTTMIFRPTPDCQVMIDELTASLNLPDEYDAIHVRRGDKVGDEDVYYPVEEYLDGLGPLSAGRTVFVMSDAWEAVQQVRDHLDELGTSVRVVTLVQPDRTGFDVWKLRRGEPFIGEGKQQSDKQLEKYYVRDNTRMLIAETLIAAGAKRFVSTWLSNVGRTVWFLHPQRQNCKLLQSTGSTDSDQAQSSSATTTHHWASLRDQRSLQRRRKQYSNTNRGFRHAVVYQLSGQDLFEELSGLARAMIYAWSHQRQLRLEDDSLVRNGGSHWHELFQALVPECGGFKTTRIKERFSITDKDGFGKLSGFQPERLSFGSTALQGFREILAFFMQMLFWPTSASQGRIDLLLQELPLSDNYDALYFGPGEATDNISVVSQSLQRLQPIPEDRSVCVITGNDEVFSEVGRGLAAGGYKTRSSILRQAKNEDQLAQETRSLAELTLALRARCFVALADSRFGQAAWLLHPRKAGCHLLDRIGSTKPAENGAMVCAELQLRDGRLFELDLPANSQHLARLRDLSSYATQTASMVQLPLNGGHSALAFSTSDLVHLKLEPVSSHAPDLLNLTTPHPQPVSKHNGPVFMNTDEGHLGGYVRAAHPVSVQRGWHNGDPKCWNPKLWDWACKALKVRSVMDVGCGEGHSAKYFQDLGCRVLAIDGSVQAQRDSVIPDRHVRHDFINGPYIPARTFDMVWCCEFVEHVEEKYSHHYLTTFSLARKYIFLTYAVPGQPGWHHVNCKPEGYWVSKLERLGFELDNDLTSQAREIAEPGHFKPRGLVFVRVDGTRLALPETAAGEASTVGPARGLIAASRQALPVKNMLITTIHDRRFFLFLDIFVHPDREKIVAVMPWYNEDWDPRSEGIDFSKVELLYRGKRIRGTYIPHRLDSWEPCALLDFEDPLLAKWLKKRKSVSIQIKAGPHSRKFKLSTQPQPAYNVLMSLVIKNENRWVRHFLEYYLECLQVDHVLVYDNFTKDRDALLEILNPYRKTGKVTYIPWSYRWRNMGSPKKMIAQPQQEAHSLNRFANSRWIGFLDVDEFLRLPGTTLPRFLGSYQGANVDGLSFGLRWFHYQGALEFNEIIDVPLTFRRSRRSRLGRKRQKFLVSPHQVRFLRLHTLEEGGRELQIDDTDIYFHHYCQRDYRFKQEETEQYQYDDYMMQFADRLTLDGTGDARPEKPSSPEAWIGHISRAIAEAECGRSKLNREGLAVKGYCGVQTRHFYNNICNFNGCRYLEIGSLHGASTVAVMAGNQLDLTCIDNFSQFHGSQQEFEANIQPFRGDNHLSLLTEDCFAMDTAGMGPFDVYLYDGAHSYESQYNAIKHYFNTLAPLAVVIVDDWNWWRVQKGTQEALDEFNIPVLYRKEILLPEVNDEKNDSFEPGQESWWNGICIMLIGRNEPTESRAD